MCNLPQARDDAAPSSHRVAVAGIMTEHACMTVHPTGATLLKKKISCLYVAAMVLGTGDAYAFKIFRL